MFSDPPRRLLAIIASGLSILFVASLVFNEELPARMLGMNKLVERQRKQNWMPVKPICWALFLNEKKLIRCVC